MTLFGQRIWRVLAAAAWTVFILVLLMLPGNSVPSLPEWTLEFSPDKIVHAVLFFVHAVLLYGAMVTTTVLASRASRIRVAACVASLAFGGATELLQMLAIARSTSAADFLADGIGTALAFLFLIRQAKRIS
jgi:VanZ family protein